MYCKAYHAPIIGMRYLLSAPHTSVIVHFSNFCLNIYNLLSQMDALAKFQPDMAITLPYK